MADRATEASPLTLARMAGALYLLSIVIGFFGEISRNRLVVSGDAAATVNNIVASAFLYRLGIAAEIITLVCVVALMVLLYVLLRPVSTILAALATVLGLVGAAVDGSVRVGLFAVALLSGSAGYLKAFNPHQLQAFAYLYLSVFDYGFGVGLVLFGCSLFFVGYLIIRSAYFPKTIGVLVMIGSVSYLVNSFTLFLAPAYAATIFPVLGLAFLGEGSLCVWLLVKGVDISKWDAFDKKRSSFS